MLSRIKSVFGQTLNIFLILLLIMMTFLAISSKVSAGLPNIFGYQLKSVLSGSMEPTFKTGSIIAINPNYNPKELKAGDVITFHMDEYNLVTHRITEVIEKDMGKVFVTKGDNNDAPDSSLVIPQNIVGTYTGFTIPYVGYVMSLANSKMGMVLLLIVPGIVLLIYAVASMWKALSLSKRKTEQSSESI